MSLRPAILVLVIAKLVAIGTYEIVSYNGSGVWSSVPINISTNWSTAWNCRSGIWATTAPTRLQPPILSQNRLPISRSRIFYSNARGRREDRILFSLKKPGENRRIAKPATIMHNSEMIGHVAIGLTSRLFQDYEYRFLIACVILWLLCIGTPVTLTGLMLRRFVKTPLDQMRQGYQ